MAEAFVTQVIHRMIEINKRERESKRASKADRKTDEQQKKRRILTAPPDLLIARAPSIFP